VNGDLRLAIFGHPRRRQTESGMGYESNILDASALVTSAAETAHPSRAEVQPLGHDLSRLASGLALASVYGLALGARAGGLQLARHAFGTPLGLVVVAAVAAPALFVRLALLDAPLRPAQMVAAMAHSTFATGLVLAGLAPAAAMLVVSIESAEAAAWMSGLGLWLAGAIGLCNLFSALGAGLAGATLRLRSRAFLAIAVFAVLACALSARAWVAWLPVLGGAS
jgi:hypothetical protein